MGKAPGWAEERTDGYFLYVPEQPLERIFFVNDENILLTHPSVDLISAEAGKGLSHFSPEQDTS